MSEQGIQSIPTDILKLMIGLCPHKKDGPNASVTFSTGGKSVKLTYQSRLNGKAELERRKKAGKQ